MCLQESMLHLTDMAKRVPSDSEKTLFPLHASLDELREASKTCKACDLWKLGTQTVFGEGMPTAKIMLVGEQPGNQEDLEGKPFVGPAGKLLDAALKEAGIESNKSLRDKCRETF
jgi:uracil-DNA glycosylase